MMSPLAAAVLLTSAATGHSDYLTLCFRPGGGILQVVEHFAGFGDEEAAFVFAVGVFGVHGSVDGFTQARAVSGRSGWLG